MINLSSQRCSPPARGALPFTASEVENWLPLVPGWQMVEVDEIQRLRKTYNFSVYEKMLEFACQVGANAEEQDHHPKIMIEWGSITIEWWTHAVKGLHRNDFIMAAISDKLYQTFSTTGVDNH